MRFRLDSGKSTSADYLACELHFSKVKVERVGYGSEGCRGLPRALGEVENMVEDLVCGMEVNESSAKYSMLIESEMYFFCSEGCLAEFKRRPQEYLNPANPCCIDSLEEKSDV